MSIYNYHDRSAAILIQSGAENQESWEWVSMLLRMYLRWADRSDIDGAIIDSVHSIAPMGFHSVLLLMNGLGAYGHLINENGGHSITKFSLIRNCRYTAFADVLVGPVLDESDCYIDPLDVVLFAYKTTGSTGGVAKGVGARLLYIPTGLTIRCANYRTFEENVATIESILRGLLYARQQRFDSNGICRRYVLHPYKRVYDTHTGKEIDDVEGVLDGKLDPFILIDDRVF